MGKGWLQQLYGSTLVEFRSAYGLAESVERLRAATKRSVFSSFGETTAVGKVSAEKVRLQRVIPMVGNSFKPFFIGRFEERGGVTVLTGAFTMLWIVKVFMTFWFGLMAVAAVPALFGAFNAAGPGAWFFRVQPLLMGAFGIGLVALGKWFARNDAAWLSRVIEGALGVRGPEGSTGASAARGAVVVDPAAVPGVLKAVAAFLALTAVMAVVGGLAGQELPKAGQGVPGLVLPSWGSWVFVYAGFQGVLAIGVWRRQPWAWWAFFGLLVLSAVWPLFGLSSLQVPGVQGPPPWMGTVIVIFTCAVVAIWGRWWYAQRKHFLWG